MVQGSVDADNLLFFGMSLLYRESCSGSPNSWEKREILKDCGHAWVTHIVAEEKRLTLLSARIQPQTNRLR